MSSSVFIVGGSSVRDLYTRFVSGVFFPLHERLKGHDTTRVRRGLEETQWWPRERLDALRLERLRGLLGHAYRYVPYYKDVLGRAGHELRRSTKTSFADHVAHTDPQRAIDIYPSSTTRPLQHRWLQRRTAGIFAGQRPREPRCRRQEARAPLVVRGYRRSGGGGMGLTHRAGRAGSPAQSA